MNIIERWITKSSKDKSFADIGGLWGTVNEKTTIAVNAGARSSTMVDFTPLGTDLWDKFNEHCTQKNISTIKCKQADLNDPTIVDKIGTYDVVHSSGVIYHCPNPIYTIKQYHKITDEYLIMGSTVLDGKIHNEHGIIELTKGSLLYVPSLMVQSKKIIMQYFYEVGAKKLDGISNSETDWNIDNYSPWWWLYTTEYLEAQLNTSGFIVQEITKNWDGRVAYFFCKKK